MTYWDRFINSPLPFILCVTLLVIIALLGWALSRPIPDEGGEHRVSKGEPGRHRLQQRVPATYFQAPEEHHERRPVNMVPIATLERVRDAIRNLPDPEPAPAPHAVSAWGGRTVQQLLDDIETAVWHNRPVNNLVVNQI